jgi:MFS transporter, FHS family, L-fucose permease
MNPDAMTLHGLALQSNGFPVTAIDISPQALEIMIRRGIKNAQLADMLNCLTYFFMSIMFPSIFALGLKNLGSHTKRVSSFLVMAIVGGAVCPYFMGLIADHFSMQTGFIVPLFCFAFIVYYGLLGKPKITELYYH